jgi:hypothetical protein
VNVPTQLIYPSLDLFIYDLREGLGQSDNDIERNRHNFWRKIEHDLNKDYKELTDSNREKLQELAKAEKPEADFAELLRPKSIFKQFDLPLDGSYYPVQFGDVYALKVGCSGKYTTGNQPNYASQPINCFQGIKQTIEAHIYQQKGNIGQTLFAWGQLVDTQQDLEQTAKECYRSIGYSTWEKDLWGKGSLLGGIAFELWQTPSTHQSGDGYHVVICLFPAQLTIKEICENRIAKIYLDLMYLFYYRHKIIWAYHQSQTLKNTLKQGFVKIKKLSTETAKEVKAQRLDLSFLETNLDLAFDLISEYGSKLTELHYQESTIKVSLDNYRERLKKIQSTYPDSDLKFQEDFKKLTAPKYQKQAEADYNAFSPGLVLLDSVINAIRGNTEIYEANRDRRFNETIAMVGIGLATSQVASSIILNQPSSLEAKHPLLSVVHPAFWGSLAVGIIAAVLIRCILRVPQALRWIVLVSAAALLGWLILSYTPVSTDKKPATPNPPTPQSSPSNS